MSQYPVSGNVGSYCSSCYAPVSGPALAGSASSAYTAAYGISGYPGTVSYLSSGKGGYACEEAGSIYTPADSSVLEAKIVESARTMVDMQQKPGITKDYLGKIDSRYLAGRSRIYSMPLENLNNFKPSVFLNEERLEVPFINTPEEIREHIERAFEKTAGFTLPGEIMISVLDPEDFRKAYLASGGETGENSLSGVAGFSVNGNGKKASRIFVRQDDLDKVMITIGHELGHVISPSLRNKHDEEAKAFAFEFAWIKTIQEENIANLAFNLKPNIPALNGLHNMSDSFISRILRKGENALDIYKGLVSGAISMVSSLEDYVDTFNKDIKLCGGE